MQLRVSPPLPWGPLPGPLPGPGPPPRAQGDEQEHPQGDHEEHREDGDENPKPPMANRGGLGGGDGGRVHFRREVYPAERPGAA